MLEFDDADETFAVDRMNLSFPLQPHMNLGGPPGALLWFYCQLNYCSLQVDWVYLEALDMWVHCRRGHWFWYWHGRLVSKGWFSLLALLSCLLLPTGIMSMERQEWTGKNGGVSWSHWRRCTLWQCCWCMWQRGEGIFKASEDAAGKKQTRQRKSKKWWYSNTQPAISPCLFFTSPVLWDEHFTGPFLLLLHFDLSMCIFANVYQYISSELHGPSQGLAEPRCGPSGYPAPGGPLHSITEAGRSAVMSTPNIEKYWWCTGSDTECQFPTHCHHSNT